MLLSPYDFHDIYAVFLLLRAYPTDPSHILAVAAVKDIIDAPQSDNCVLANIIRNKLSEIPSLDREKWYFIDTPNVYTWMYPLVREELAYAILSACLDEMLIALNEKDTDRIYDLADAIHNIPIILTKGEKTMRTDIQREISYVYRPKWNKAFLKSIL